MPLPGLLTRRLDPLREEAGFTIIEVLVSALVVALAVVGTFSAFDSATATSGTNKARSAAAAIAQSDQERLRGMTPQQLAALTPTTTKTVDNRTYTITSSATWVIDRAGTPTCSSADGRADYLRITSSVTWASMGSLRPVKSESLRAIPQGAFRPEQGSVAVQVLDSRSNGVAGVSVSLTGTQNFSGTTNSLGCLVLDNVPVGTYTVTGSKAGYITDKLPNDATVVQSAVVARAQTSNVRFTLDRPGTARVLFRTTTAVGGTTEANTTGEAFTLSHTGLGYPNLRTFTLPTGLPSTLYSGADALASTSSTVRDVFPFDTPYAIWAGGCVEGNPALYGQPANPIATSGGGGGQLIPVGGLATSVNIREPRLQVAVKKSSGNLSGSRVVFTNVVTGCSRTVGTSTTTTTVTTHTVAQTLPYGSYLVCTQEGTSTGTSTARRSTQSFDNKVANGSSYTVTLPDTTSSGTCG